MLTSAGIAAVMAGEEVYIMHMNRLFDTCRWLRFASLFALFVLPAMTGARAASIQDINLLIRQGQYTQALEQLNAYVDANPRDAQGRFLKGVVLTELKRPAEALAVFSKMTVDYPELPEPYNNMAVIYAQQNQYDKARQALEMAIRTHPSYATAHENLGDIYATLASQAYDKALQLDSANASAKNKLALIRSLVITSSTAAKASSPSPSLFPSPPPAPNAGKQPVPTPNPPTVPSPDTKQPASPVLPDHAATSSEAEVQAITQAIDAWSAAWARKDVSAYFAAYAKDFTPPAGSSRAAWETERRKRILKPGAIKISYDNLRISVDGASAVARFRQYYASGAFKSTTNKTLELVQKNGKWLIQQERIGN